MALTLEEAQRLDWTPSWQRLSARFPDSCASERRADWREREGNPCVERAAASIRGGGGAPLRAVTLGQKPRSLASWWDRGAAVDLGPLPNAAVAELHP